MKFNLYKFDKWEEETHIPEAVMNMVRFIAEKIGYEGYLEEETIQIYNRGGQVIGWAKGFSISHCTSSYEDGPGIDYSDAFVKWLVGLGFSIENSYGDNGIDSSTNWHDTYWHYDFIFNSTQVWEEDFIEWSEAELQGW